MKLPTAALRAYARDAFVHAPVEVLMGIAVALAFSVAMRQKGGEDWWARVFVAAVLALPLVFGASVLRARGVLGARARWGATGLALGAAGAYAAFLFHPDLESEGWRAGALAAAAWLVLLLAPAIGGGDDGTRRRRVWRFDALLLIRIVAVGLYGAALFAALAGAVSAVRSLFELKTPQHLYEDIGGAIFFALVPWVVAGGVPLLAADGADGPTPVTVRRAGRYLYAVVLVVYLAILFAYTAKVLATGDLPKNLLSPIVLFAGLAGLLGGIFLEPLQDDAESRGVARLVRLFPALLLPLLPLPIWAVGVRQDQYGWTEFRYLRLVVLLALAVLAVWGTIRLVRRRPPLLVVVPAVLAAALLLGSVGPWSAQAVSRRDQGARLRAALTAAGLMRDGRLTRALLPPGRSSVARDTVATGQYERIAGALTYLYDAHGARRTARVLGTEVGSYENGWQLLAALGIREGCRRQPTRTYFGTLPPGTPIPEAQGTLYPVMASDPALRGASAPGAPTLTLHGTRVQVAIAGAAPWTGHAELAALTRALVTRTPGACGEPQGPILLAAGEARVPIVDTGGRTRGTLVVTSVSYGNQTREALGRNPPGPMRLERVEGILIVSP